MTSLPRNSAPHSPSPIGAEGQWGVEAVPRPQRISNEPSPSSVLGGLECRVNHIYIYIYIYIYIHTHTHFPGDPDCEESAYNRGDSLSSIPGTGRFPGEGNGSSLQYFCLENPMGREAWRATVHEVAKSWTQQLK